MGIHPRFGNFVLLATPLLDAEVSAHGEALDHNPCLACKRCVADSTDAAAYARRRFPHKPTREVTGGRTPAPGTG